MPRNASGVYSLPPGNPVVAGTLIEAAWANSTLGDVAAEITNSLSRNGQGGMTAPLRLVDGSVSAPALAFNIDTATGIYRIGTGQIGVAAGGVLRLAISSSGVSVIGDISASGISVTGNISASGVSVTGNISVSGTISGNGSGLTSLNASNLASGTIPAARFPDPLPTLSGANLTNLNASNLTSGTVPNARISGAYTNITAIGNGASHLSIATNGNITCSAQILGTANVVARQGASGNAHFLLRSNTDVEQGILYWDSSDDSVVVGRHNSAGTSIENYYSLTSGGAAVIRSTSSSKTVNYTFDHNGLSIAQPGNTDLGYIFFSNGQGERVRLYATDTRALIVSCNNGSTAHLTVNSTGVSAVGSVIANGGYVYSYRNADAGFISHCNDAPANQKFAYLYGWSAGWSLNFYNDSFGGAVEVFTIGRSGTMPTDFVCRVRTRTQPVYVPFAYVITIDARLSNVFYVDTLTASPSYLVINNPADGQTIMVRFVQDYVGYKVVNLPSGTLILQGSMNTAPYSVSWLQITYVASASRWEGHWIAPATSGGGGGGGAG